MRYAVFAYDGYYPGGGWQDFQGFADTRGEADALAESLVREWDYSQVVDLTSGEVVRDLDPWRDKQEAYALALADEKARLAAEHVPPEPIVTEAVYTPTGEVLGPKDGAHEHSWTLQEVQSLGDGARGSVYRCECGLKKAALEHPA